MLEVRLLGQFDIALDGVPIEITSRSSQSLFSYLILNPNTAYRREKLAGQFWPEASESNARNSLRQALWRIRRAFHPGANEESDFFIADGFTIGFNPNANYVLDADLLKEDQASSAEDLIQAVSAYKGELLPGFYEEWIVLSRESLQVAYEHKMHLLLEKLVAAEAWQDVIKWGEHWIAQGQVPEIAYRGVMIAHGGLGDTSKVAAVYQRCVEALREELDVQPSAETTRVYEVLARGEKPQLMNLGMQVGQSEGIHPIPEPHFPEFLEMDDPAPQQPFVARKNELARMQKSMEGAIAGKGSVLFVQGEAGSGKTALLQAFARKAHESDQALLIALGSSNAVTGVGQPYLPFRELLELLTGDLENVWSSGGITREIARRVWANVPQAVGALVEQGPDLIGSFVPGEDVLSRAKAYAPNSTAWLKRYERVIRDERDERALANLDQTSLFGQYVAFLQALASEAPLLLMLDDLQWADLGSISLLFHLGRRLQEHSVLVIGAFRPDELVPDSDGGRHPLTKVVAEFKRTFGDIVIDLGGITEIEGRSFVDAFLDTESNDFGESFRVALYQHTSGHPLFTVELLRAMEARGAIEQDNEGRWAESLSLDWETLPPKIEGVIEERLGRLEESQLRIMRIASVEGNEFTAEVVASILGAEIVEALSGELDKRHRLVSATRVLWVGSQRVSHYRFRHIFFAKYLYEKLDPVQRAHLHLEVGELLEGIYAKDTREIAGQLAHHFAEAGIPQKAIQYFGIAGEHAKRLSANEEAILHLKRGIDLLQNVDGLEKEELTLQISLAAPLIATRGYGAPEAQLVFARARQLSAHVDDVPQLFSVMYALRSYYLVRAEHETAREIGEQLLELAKRDKDPALRLEALEAYGSTLFYRGELTEAQRTLEEAISIYDPHLHNSHAYLFGQDPAVASWSYLALTQWSLGYAKEATEASNKSLALARQIAHPFSLALALNFAALHSALLREGEKAQALAHEAIVTASKHNFPVWLAVGEILSGWAEATLGHPEDGLMRMSKGISAWEATGAKLARPYFLGLQAEALLAGGQVNLGLTVIDHALEAVQFGKERVNEAELHRLRGLLLQANGQSSEEAFQKSLQIASEHGAMTIALRSALELGKQWSAEGNREKGREIVREVVDRFVDGMNVEDLNDAQAFLGE